nr:uncharacterized protein LOC109403541 [Aedes albopictus]
MEHLKKKRIVAEGRLNGIRSRINEFNTDTAGIDDLTAELDSLLEWWQDFSKLQDDCINLCTDDNALDGLIQVGNEMEKRYNAVKATVTQFIRVVQNRDNAPVTPRPVLEANIAIPELNLPKGLLPTFSGDYAEWTSFYDLFVSSVHNNPRLTDAQRLLYLKTYTSGSAAALLRHIKVEDRAYQGALDALKKRFDRKDHIVSHQIQRYLDIPPSSVASASSLRRAYSVADDVIRALKASQREERDSWLIQLLLIKLDPETRQQWADRSNLNNGNAQPPSIDQFLEFLDQRAFIMEAIHRPTSHRTNDTPTKSTQRHCSSFITTNATEVPICTLCTDQQHHLYFCHDSRTYHRRSGCI